MVPKAAKKILSFFPRFSTFSLPNPEEDRPVSEHRVLPSLPIELWCKIIGYTVRIPGASSVGLEDPFATPYEGGQFPVVDPLLFKDRSNLCLVCSKWRALVFDISAEYLVVHSDKQLKMLIKTLKSYEGGRHGKMTKRIDFVMRGDYSVPNIIRLLRMTPNLLIYRNHNDIPHELTQRCTPTEVIAALIENCGKSLRKIEWTGGESPRYEDFAELCNCLPNLTTIHLESMSSYPRNRDRAPTLLLPQVKNLCLGNISSLDTRPQYSMTWDPLFQYLSATPEQLPLLERLECDILPIQTMSFFTMHGHKIRLFRTTAWSVEDRLPMALDLCPNLRSLLLLTLGVETMHLPTYHPTLERICLSPNFVFYTNVPPRIYNAAIIKPLDMFLKSLEGMSTPNLIELRIRNTGEYTDLINHTSWLRQWWTRWNIRGVHFSDKDGTPYIDVRDPQESLLNSVRG